MTTKDIELVAAGFAAAEAMQEELGDANGHGSAALRIAADAIAGRIAQRHPRFSAAAFYGACFPRAEERKKRAILRAIGRSAGDVDGPEIPADFPVQPIEPGDPAAVDPATCGTCGLTWDDGISTSWTPAPSGRCPFEYFHVDEESAGA
jgi:hypothetical protein